MSILDLTVICFPAAQILTDLGRVWKHAVNVAVTSDYDQKGHDKTADNLQERVSPRYTATLEAPQTLFELYKNFTQLLQFSTTSARDFTEVDTYPVKSQIN